MCKLEARLHSEQVSPFLIFGNRRLANIVFRSNHACDSCTAQKKGCSLVRSKKPESGVVTERSKGKKMLIMPQRLSTV